MVWRTSSVEQQRSIFIQEALDPSTKGTFEELCDKYNITRKTGYKWLNRFFENGEAGLKDLSRARLTQASKISSETVTNIVNIRQKFADLGPKKINAMMKEYGYSHVPAASTIGNYLRDNNLSKPRHYRRHVAKTASLTECNNPNDVWMYDFKGYFTTQDGLKCEPLTITDGYSRYLIACDHLDRKRTQDVWAILERVFFEYGLPNRLRSDNGPPFATTGVGRLSPLAIKVIKAGVIPEWIEPGCPQQNGRHERFHLTLKNATANPPAQTRQLQIYKMNQFREFYNHERPHESLGQIAPSKVYYPSNRIWDGKFRPPEYSGGNEIRKVGKSGSITWKGTAYFLSESLCGEYVEIKELEMGLMAISYGPILLGKIDLNKGFKRL